MTNQEQSPSPAPVPPAGRVTRLSAFFLLSFGYVGLRFLLSPVRSRLLTGQLPKALYGSLTLAVTTVTFLATLLALGGYEFLARRLPGLPAARQKGWLSLLLRRLALPGWLAAGAAALLVRLSRGPLPGLSDADLLCLWADLGLTLWLLYRVFYALGCGRLATLRAIQLFQNDLWFVAVFAAGAWAAAAFSHALWIWTAWLAVLALAVLAFDRHPGPAEPPGGGVRDVLAFGLPLMPMMLGENLFRLADRYLLAHFRDMAVVAEYTLAMNIAMMAYVTGASLLDLVIPRLYAAANRRTPAGAAASSAPTGDMRRLFSLMVRHMTGLGAILGLALAFFRRDVFAIIAGPNFRDAADLMPWIAPIPLAFLLSMVASRALLAQDRSRLVGGATLGAALVNLAVDFAIVPRWGAAGAAVATFGSMLALAVFLMAVLRAHRWLVRDEWKPFRLAAGILACAAVYHLVDRLLPAASPWLRLPFAALPTIPILFLSRIFTPSDAALLKSSAP